MARFSELEADEAAAAAKEFEDEYEHDQDGFFRAERTPILRCGSERLGTRRLDCSRPSREAKSRQEKPQSESLDLPETDIIYTRQGKEAMDPKSRRSSQQELSKVFVSVVDRAPGDAVLELRPIQVPESTSMPMSRFKQRHGG
ncbi:hypothetical protein SELMODRAFT_418205 [Selaginella moellendorffii]|uniref:Uncharacterized protein n=1 Tax=Selaginella moellendorffii TaxID=88036 RepID=D8S504_SELML|nr:hypothetical protein SELMODRAFT_418205 [Selaginella moellendorffii]